MDGCGRPFEMRGQPSSPWWARPGGAERGQSGAGESARGGWMRGRPGCVGRVQWTGEGRGGVVLDRPRLEF